MAGPLAAITRAIDTVIGCLLGFAAYLLFPTWQRRRLDELLSEWARAEADRLVALSRLWAEEAEEHRLAVAHASVLSRLIRIEFAAATKSARSEPEHPQGRWSDADLDPAAAAVLTVARQIAALSALAPYWSEAERGDVHSDVERLTGELLALAGGAEPPVEPTARADVDARPGEVTLETRAALDQASRAVAQLALSRRPTD